MDQNDEENKLKLEENQEEENKQEEVKTEVGDSEQQSSSTDTSKTDGSKRRDGDVPASSDDDGKDNYLLLFYRGRV